MTMFNHQFNAAAAPSQAGCSRATIIAKGSDTSALTLNRNEPVFYAVPPALYESMLEAIDNAHLAEIVRARRGEPTIRVNIDDLIKEAGGTGEG